MRTNNANSKRHPRWLNRTVLGIGLATVNGVGDFVSSAVVGALWTAFGTSVAFGYSAVLFAAGAVLVLGVGKPSVDAATR